MNMISEGACDTVDWSNSWSNEDLPKKKNRKQLF